MNASIILRTVIYAIAGLILVTGIVILSGYLIPEHVSKGFRTTMGIMMVIYGTYRIVIVTVKNRRKDETEE